MLDFLTLKHETFGLDISNLSLKIVKLKKRGKFLRLASFEEAEISPGMIKKGEIQDEESLVKIIKETLSKVKGEKLRTKYVVVSLPEERSFSQVIQMPKMKEEELKSAVQFEAENYIPLPIDEVYLDFQVIRPVYNHLDHLDILITALPKKTVDSYVHCLKKAGLIPQVLEVESQAIARALVKNETSRVPLLLIDFGKSNTSFILFSGYSIRFTCSLPISSHQLTQAISQALKVDLKQAEKLKMKYDLKKREKDAQSEKILQAMTPVLTDLIKQTKEYLSFYRTHSSHEHLSPPKKAEARPQAGRSDGKGVKKILLCGGGANLKGFTDFLSQELKIPVEIGSPWVNILAKSQKKAPQLSQEKSLSYTTALGLALRGIKEK